MALSGCGTKRVPTARRDEHRKQGAFHTHSRYSLQRRRRKRGSHAICHQAEAHHTCTLFWVKGSGICLTTCKLHNISLSTPHYYVRYSYLHSSCVLLLFPQAPYKWYSSYITCEREEKQQSEAETFLTLSMYVKGMGYE